MKKISQEEVVELIKKYNLKIYKSIWHYSFNDIFKKNFYLKKKGDTINLFSKSLNIFCPPLIYTNNDKVVIKTGNVLTEPYDSKNEARRSVFWYLRTNSFQDFLLSTTRKSPRRAHYRFPTSKTYPVYKEKYPVIFNYSPFDKDYFVKNYNNLKLPQHLSGEKVVELLFENNPGLPLDWVKIATLKYDNEIVAIASLIDDNRSIFADNMASKRSKIGFGIYLFAEIIRYACENNYFSFDGGVSGLYGGYKKKVFIDSSEVYQPSPSRITYLAFWKKGFWKKVQKKITRK